MVRHLKSGRISVKRMRDGHVKLYALRCGSGAHRRGAVFWLTRDEANELAATVLADDLGRRERAQKGAGLE